MCRPVADCMRGTARYDIGNWIKLLRPLNVSKADQKSLAHAVSTVSARFGVLSRVQDHQSHSDSTPIPVIPSKGAGTRMRSADGKGTR